MRPWLGLLVVFLFAALVGCGKPASAVPEKSTDEEKLQAEQKSLNELRKDEWGKRKK